ncbi:MAG: class I SAM-dependent methyltransferase [Spirochaetia bacterium]
MESALNTAQSLRHFLKKRFQERRKWAILQQRENYRIFNYDQNAPLFIDFYGGKYLHVSVQEHPLYDPPTIRDIVHEATGIARAQIFLKVRERLCEKEQYTRQDSTSAIFWVEEESLHIKVNLSDYIDTGFFLDHRIARETIRASCFDQNVLNLFCYTGTFSLFAAIGGAKKVTSIDISSPYLQWAKENFDANQINSPAYEFLQQDVLEYLAQPIKEKYHIIILDPPVFSNSRKMKTDLNIERDHPFLINACLERVHSTGYVFFSTPLTTLRLKNEKIAGLVEEITKKTIDLDFKGKPPHKTWLIYPEKGRKKSSRK